MGAKESKNGKKKLQVTIGRELDQGDTPFSLDLTERGKLYMD